MREITLHELNTVAGAGSAIGTITEYYPDLLEGYEIIGWSHEIIGYDTFTSYKPGGFFSPAVVTHDNYPIYEFKPIYGPLPQTIVVI